MLSIGALPSILKISTTGLGKTENNFDSSTCVATYEEASPSTVDIATTLSGGSVSMTGTSTMPSEGVYGYPYIILGSSFNIIY